MVFIPDKLISVFAVVQVVADYPVAPVADVAPVEPVAAVGLVAAVEQVESVEPFAADLKLVACRRHGENPQTAGKLNFLK